MIFFSIIQQNSFYPWYNMIFFSKNVSSVIQYDICLQMFINYDTIWQSHCFFHNLRYLMRVKIFNLMMLKLTQRVWSTCVYSINSTKPGDFNERICKCEMDKVIKVLYDMIRSNFERTLSGMSIFLEEKTLTLLGQTQIMRSALFGKY